jgi:8-oxo-dGTP pyrophosphatase MutT (NUDIX family)
MAWTVESSRYIVRDEPWLSIREEACRTASGHAIDPFYVLEYPDWVNVVALTDDDEIVLVRQYRHAVGRRVLELPSGMIDASDASPEEAARRELLEETGFAAASWQQVGQLSANPATHTNTAFCYLATGARRVEEPTLDAGEELESLLMPLSEAVRRARGGELLQALHVAGLFLALATAGRLGA